MILDDIHEKKFGKFPFDADCLKILTVAVFVTITPIICKNACREDALQAVKWTINLGARTRNIL